MTGEFVDLEVRADGKLTQIACACVSFEHFEQIILVFVGAGLFHTTVGEGQLRAFDSHAAIDSRVCELDPAIDRVLDRAGENLAIGHIVCAAGIQECATLDRERQVNVGSTQDNLVFALHKIHGCLLVFSDLFPVSDRIRFVGVHSAEDKISILLKTHLRILGIAIGGIQCGDPFECALCAS